MAMTIRECGDGVWDLLDDEGTVVAKGSREVVEEAMTSPLQARLLAGDPVEPSKVAGSIWPPDALALSVECPACKAAPGVVCESAPTETISHRRRYALAFRLRDAKPATN